MFTGEKKVPDSRSDGGGRLRRGLGSERWVGSSLAPAEPPRTNYFVLSVGKIVGKITNTLDMAHG